MRKSLFTGLFLLILTSFLSTSLNAQEKETVHWLSFEQLQDSLEVRPKKVFIDFYTDWCAYCRKMDKVVFTKPEIILELNTNYYAVRFDAETEAPIRFGNQTYINDQVGKSRSPIHQIAQLLALRDSQFAPPTLVILDEDFKVTSRHFQYLDSKKLLEALK